MKFSKNVLSNIPEGKWIRLSDSLMGEEYPFFCGRMVNGTLVFAVPGLEGHIIISTDSPKKRFWSYEIIDAPDPQTLIGFQCLNKINFHTTQYGTIVEVRTVAHPEVVYMTGIIATYQKIFGIVSFNKDGVLEKSINVKSPQFKEDEYIFRVVEQ
ncbi:MAG: hypothetical protein AAB870_03595 [Patescibacteria group bacterium]